MDSAGIGLPKYYEWRSRSGCTFCFFQKKIEWVHLLERHPDKFAEAMRYEKIASDSGTPFTWSERESLAELSRPERVAEIKADYEKRRLQELKRRPSNPLRVGLEVIDIDDLYGDDEGAGACTVCSK